MISVKTAVAIKRAVDFVRRDMQEPERLASLASTAPVPQRLLQQRERADDVGANELGRTVDRAVDVALGREVEHRLRLITVE